MNFLSNPVSRNSEESISGTATTKIAEGKAMIDRSDARRASGLRLVQLWVPDSRAPGFAEECRRQTALAAASDRADADLGGFLDAALEDLGVWK